MNNRERAMAILNYQPLRYYLNIVPALFFAVSLAIEKRDWMRARALPVFLVFLAFNVPVTLGTLVAGFSIGNLFNIVSPTPSGIGIVEGTLTLALASLRVPLAAATVVALVYRGIVIWLPLLLGMITFRWILHSGASQPVDPIPQGRQALNEQLPD